MQIAVLDFGSQYSHLLQRWFHSQGFACDLIKPDDWKTCYTAYVISGGPNSVYAENAPLLPHGFLSHVMRMRRPLLGVCYGHQLVAKYFGGTITQGDGEYGATSIFDSAGSESTAWSSHKDYVTTAPQGFEVSFTNKDGAIEGMRSHSLPIMTVQFHPEVQETQNGDKILADFVSIFSTIEKSKTVHRNVKTLSSLYKETIKESPRFICALSGGVDSLVAACKVQNDYPGSVKCVYVDTGLMRYDDRSTVTEVSKQHDLNLEIIDAREKFFGALSGVTEPEEKRKIIGRCFIEVLESVLTNSNSDYLIQGTIYPDIVESGVSSKHNAKIKSHHNVGGIPENCNLKIVEPLRELYKDEVRLLGSKLDISLSALNRHPFPGPGLAIRIIGEVTQSDAELLSHIDRVVRQELDKPEFGDIWQLFPVLLPVRSVGVQGDGRTYGRVCAIRAVSSRDGMTASLPKSLTIENLSRVSNKITSEIPEINRVLYDLTTKPPGTIEWE